MSLKFIFVVLIKRNRHNCYSAKYYKKIYKVKDTTLEALLLFVNLKSYYNLNYMEKYLQVHLNIVMN